MAFAAVGSLGSSFEKVSDTSFSITVGATAEVGNVVVVFAACDNIGTTEAESNELTISDSAGNTWSKKEYRFSAGAAGDGVTGIIAWSKLTSQLTSGSGTITVTASSAVTTKLLAAYEFTMGSGDLTLETQLFDGASVSDPIALTFSGLPSREYLFISGVFSEGGTTHTTDADYTEIFDTETTGGAVASNVSLLGAYRIATETGNTIDHASTTDRDHVQIAVALYEAAGGGTSHTKNLSDTITLSDAVAKSIRPAKSDTITLSDSVAKAIGLAKSDTITLTDSLAKAMGLSKGDTITLSDAFGRVWTISRSFADTLNLSDDINAVEGGGTAHTLNLEDTINLTDALVKSVFLTKSDTLSLSDSLAKAIGKPLADTLTTSDAIAKRAALAKADSVTLTDTLSKGFGKAVSDALTLADAVNILLNGETPWERLGRARVIVISRPGMY